MKIGLDIIKFIAINQNFPVFILWIKTTDIFDTSASRITKNAEIKWNFKLNYDFFKVVIFPCEP